MNRRGGAEPCRAGLLLDSNGFTNWHQDCKPQTSDWTFVAMGDSPRPGSQLVQDIRAARSSAQLSRLREKSIKTTTVRSLPGFGTRCGQSAGRVFSSVGPRIEWGRTG